MTNLENIYNSEYRAKVRKPMGKEILKSFAISLGIASFIFMVLGIIFDLAGKGNYVASNYAIAKMGLGCIITACGFGISTFVYQIEGLAKGLASFIHMAIGISVYVIVSILAGWMPVKYGIGNVLAFLGVSIGVSLLIWFFIYIKYKNESKRINKAIKAKNG